MSLPISASEPSISVGLLTNAQSVSLKLLSDFRSQDGKIFAAGDYTVKCQNGCLECSGARSMRAPLLQWTPVNAETGRFSIETTIGINFHWQQKEIQTFSGTLRLVPRAKDRLTAINDVSLETYLSSVTCSEMSASSPPSFIRCHAIISRSWILAQLETRGRTATVPKAIDPMQHIRWYDRESHSDFDVCADDHCQRYQGVGRIQNPEVLAAIRETRGIALSFSGNVCDARFSKCCGGVSEDFRVAWGDEKIPYLVPVFDGLSERLPPRPLTDETAFREFIENPPDVYCHCRDPQFLKTVLPFYDQKTEDFFRWTVTLTADQATELLRQKLGVDIGRIIRLEPVERGHSGRLKRLRFVGDSKALIVGKELEIRKALSPTHLYSSAFVVDSEGPTSRPERFILRGSGWGHGVGLCQIGAAVMAHRGIPYPKILRHYYPGTELKQLYR